MRIRGEVAAKNWGVWGEAAAYFQLERASVEFTTDFDITLRFPMLCACADSLAKALASASAGASLTAAASASATLQAAASLAGQAPSMSGGAMAMKMIASLIKMLQSLGLDLMAFAPCSTG